MSVQVILREPVDHLGRRGDIVKVATGYARNYLLPRKLALPVTEANRRQVARERVVADVRDEEEKQAAAVFAERLSQVVCVIARRVGYKSFLSGHRGAMTQGGSEMMVKRDHLLAGWGNYQLRYFFS